MKEGVNLLYDSVVVNLGARCNASCEHCCFSCSPTKKEALDKNEVINLVENFSNNPKIKLSLLLGEKYF